ncbi:MAG: crotonobetainyl-CoA:carnitine CoA-transferase CaiB-like acyl-CoA transferase [Gammaproteobacteria bacterium]|jgi:crotonobetainyl-CoA:carnitine CoA-transferase CaiB-like acyl-CoA transferase
MLKSLRVIQIGNARAAAVCTRLFADLGARVEVLETSQGALSAQSLLDDYLARDKHHITDKHADSSSLFDTLRDADLIVLGDTPANLSDQGLLPGHFANAHLRGALVYITPWGLSGPKANEPACDLTLLCASGIARVLTGQVVDSDEAPVRAVGDQTAFISALAAACIGMHLILANHRWPTTAGAPRHADVSMHEALAMLDIQALSRAGLGRPQRSRQRTGDGNGATVTILPCADGHVAISPREDHQWRRWLEVMGSPSWGEEARFARKLDRVANFDALHALMSTWSRSQNKHDLAQAAQTAHVPCFALGTPAEQLRSTQLAGRGFFRDALVQGNQCKIPGLAFGIELFPARADTAPVSPDQNQDSNSHKLPLTGVRVLDFSWVIAGPTTTRYLAALGAEVIKVEAPGRGDPGRTSELHTVLGQGKRAITLDLKTESGRELAQSLVRKSDVVIENFATGVMDRLGLGESSLRAIKPELIYLSASGLGRTGPESTAVAYGTLLQCYAGFAALNGHPDRAPRVGMAWLDPMCALKLAFIVAAALWRRKRDGSGVRVDFSMIEAMLWTMAKPLLDVQLGDEPHARGNHSTSCAPHGVYPANGDDAWLAIAVRSDVEWHKLCAIVPELGELTQLDFGARVAQCADIDARLANWCASADPAALHSQLIDAGVPSSPVNSPNDLFANAHLKARGFWNAVADGHLPGLPWQIPGGGASYTPAPELGADNTWVTREVLGLSEKEHLNLRTHGAFGDGS